MKLSLKEFFAGFLRTRHIGRHFRRLVLLDSLTNTTVSREVPPTLANTLVDAAHSYGPRAAVHCIHWGVDLARFAPAPWQTKPGFEIVSLRSWEPNYNIATIIDALQILTHSPQIGRPVQDGMRELVIGRAARGYVALYHYVAAIDTVFVLAVRSQPIGKLFFIHKLALRIRPG